MVVGVKHEPFNRSDTTITPLDVFDARIGDSQIVWDASTRMTRRVRHSGADFYDIMASFEEQGPVNGRPLALTPLFAGSFTAGPNGGPTGGGCGGTCDTTKSPTTCASREDPRFSPAVTEFKEMYCTTANCLSYGPPYAQITVGWGKINFDTLNKTVQVRVASNINVHVREQPSWSAPL